MYKIIYIVVLNKYQHSYSFEGDIEKEVALQAKIFADGIQEEHPEKQINFRLEEQVWNLTGMSEETVKMLL